MYNASQDQERPEALPRPLGGTGAFYRGKGKRMFDLLLVLGSLPMILPLILAFACLIAREGGQPFFGHRRVGRDGRIFTCWKLRSMVTDAEERLRIHLANDPALRAEWETTFKLAQDPRVTKIGRFLRRSSLDELPQVWNILKGEMSLVGPRPITLDETEFYRARLRHYHALRPGLTGLWQVRGRNDVSYAARVALDVRYARSHNLRLDLWIIFATLKAVLKGTGK